MWILEHHSPAGDFESRGGGKAKNLAKLSQLGLPVPTWFCVSSDAFQEFLRANSLLDSVGRASSLSHEGAARFADEIEKKFLAAQLPSSVTEAIRLALSKHSLAEEPVAVRSSGLDEDSATQSFAGQFSSFLFQKGEASILESLKKCWASAFSERALRYRIEKKLDLNRISMGVVVQRMIDPDVAGVAFSRNPMHPLDRDTLVVSSVWGLGEGLVSGELDADHFVVDRESLESRPTLARKTHAFRRGANGGVQKAALPAGSQELPSLDDAQLKSISEMVLHLEKSLGTPQDCEWAFHRDGLALLQTRPITSLPPETYYDSRVGGPGYILWDNSNIIESFCGVTSPLTFSHVSRAYRQVYIQFCEVMGVPAEIIQKHEPTFRNMLGLVRGRVYYNLGSWYQMLVLFPGFSASKGFMETMMGVKQGLKPEIAELFDFTRNPPRYPAWRKVRLIGMTLLRIFRIRGIVDTFKRQIDVVYQVARKEDFTELSLQEQISYYYYLEKEFLHHWKAPIISDTRCMVFFGLLRSLTRKWLASADGGSLQNDLLCGQGDLPSTEPTRALMRIAEKIDQGGVEFRDWFVGRRPSEIWKQLPTCKLPGAAETLTAFRDFIDRYGFRCINELKLEETDLHDDPSFAIDAVICFVRLKNYSIAEMEKKEHAIRDRAEAIVKKELSGLKLAFYRFALRHARIAVRDREDLRFLRTNTFGVVRRLFRGMGMNFHKLGVIDDPRDVFYLTMDEMVAYGEGRSLTLDFKPLIQTRKTEFDRYRATPAPPDRFVTRGMAGMSFRDPMILADADILKSEAPQSTDPNVLMGTACCPGVVEGVVRVVLSPADAEGLRGEILVTERTDPGWVPLFPSCSGLLIERGSLLSHSALVARELGIPTIVGVSGGLLTRLKTGMKVRMDASRGEIRILAENGADHGGN